MLIAVMFSYSCKGVCDPIIYAEAFYLRHNPAKIDTVPAIVRAYRERVSKPRHIFVCFSRCTFGVQICRFEKVRDVK